MENVSLSPSLPTYFTGLGIDLGATFCSVAVLGHQHAYGNVIEHEKDLDITLNPRYSPCELDGDAKAAVAAVAGDIGQDAAFNRPENATSFDIKRLICATFENPNIQKYQKLWPLHLVKIHGILKFKVHGDPSLSRTLATKLMSDLKKTAEEKLGHSIDTAVVTVPAYFTDHHKELTKIACEEAGFRNIQCIIEPENMSASAKCLFQTPTISNGTGANACPTHDVEGRTFGAIAYQLNSNKQIEIKATGTGCDELLGREVISNLLTECCAEMFKKRNGEYSVDGKTSRDVVQNQKLPAIKLHQIRKECQIQNCSLASTSTSTSSVDVSLDSAENDTEHAASYPAVERTLFQNLIGALLNRSKQILNNTLKDSGCENEDINVGASSKISTMQKTIQWSHKIDGFPSTSAHAAVAVDNKIYSIGGINYPVNPFYSIVWPIDIFVLDIHEPELGWTQVLIEHHKSIPNQICGHTAVAYKGCVIIFGGFDTKKGKSVNSTFLFNTKTRKWIKPNVSGNIPEPCYDHTAVVLGEELIVFGGIGGTSDLHSLNLETFVWSKIQTKGTFPPILSGHSATVYNDRFMLVFGGIDSSKLYSNALMSFNFKNETWTAMKTVGAPPKKRGKHCAFMQNGLMYIFGGRQKKHIYLNDLFSFNPETAEWKEVAPTGEAPSPRADAECVVLDDQVFIFGGFCRIYYDVLLDDTTVLEI